MHVLTWLICALIAHGSVSGDFVLKPGTTTTPAATVNVLPDTHENSEPQESKTAPPVIFPAIHKWTVPRIQISTETTTENRRISTTPKPIVTSFPNAFEHTQIIFQKPTIEPTTEKAEAIRSPDPKVPALPHAFTTGIQVSDVHNGETFYVEQDEIPGIGKHSLVTNQMNMSCYFNGQTEGYLVEGVKCSKISNIPQKCFCGEKFCRPYVPIGSLLQYLRLHEAKFVKQTLSGEGSVELWKWSVVKDQMTIEAVYSLINGRRESSPSTGIHISKILQPVSFTVKGPGRDFMLPGGPIWLQYKVTKWSERASGYDALSSTPPGVFCSFEGKKFIPKLENRFSLTMETVIENLGTIAYEKQSYEADQKLVSFTYRPHLHSDGMWLMNFDGMADLSVDSYRVVHDFRTGVQYTINQSTNNCTAQAIPLSALDAAPTENQHIRMRHASELVFIDPNKFIYKGQRTVRGILCDVWIAERGIRKGRYSTVEVYFSHENWTIEVEVFNKVRQIPIGITSYVADATNPTNWTSIVHTYFYEYKDAHPSWDEFDVSPCLGRIDRMALSLSLDCSYKQVFSYDAELTKNSLRKAIAGIAGISALRVTDVFVSSDAPNDGSVSVWFALLERPDITGPVLTPRPQLPMADAIKLLRDITENHNVSVKIDLAPTKKVFVTIRRGSFKTLDSSMHPHLNQNPLHMMRAGYTAGSVAGLGFSMAILGTCVGIFIGFLLWKKRPNIPYHIRI